MSTGILTGTALPACDTTPKPKHGRKAARRATPLTRYGNPYPSPRQMQLGGHTNRSLWTWNHLVNSIWMDKEKEAHMDEIKEDSLWVRCPECHAKTRVKVYSETVLIKFPLFCPKCKHETLIDVVKLKMVTSKWARRTKRRACYPFICGIAGSFYMWQFYSKYLIVLQVWQVHDGVLQSKQYFFSVFKIFFPFVRRSRIRFVLLGWGAKRKEVTPSGRY